MTKKAFVLVGGVDGGGWGDDGRFDDPMGGLWVAYGLLWESSGLLLF